MKKILFNYIVVLWSFCMALTSCSHQPTDVTKADQLPAIYPDYIGVTIPAGIAPLNFNFADEDIDCLDVVAKGSKGGEWSGSVAVMTLIQGRSQWNERSNSSASITT